MLLNEWSERQGVANGRGPGSARGGIRCEPLRWRSHQTDPPGGSREGAVGETRAQRDALGRISVNMLVAHYFFRLPEGGSSATAAPSPGSTDVVVQAPDLRSRPTGGSTVVRELRGAVVRRTPSSVARESIAPCRPRATGRQLHGGNRLSGPGAKMAGAGCHRPG